MTMPLDLKPATRLEIAPQETVRRLDPCAVSCGSRGTGLRWHCAWTHPHDEHRAHIAIACLGFEAYLPLHLERDIWRHTHIGPLFLRYVFVRFDSRRDAWGTIANCRGVGGLIRHAPDRPTPLPDIAIAELMARTSSRGVVDDPGDGSPVVMPDGHKPVWQGLGALSAENRSRLLLRLFGRVVAEYAAEDAVA
jgi:hypothetical protein